MKDSLFPKEVTSDVPRLTLTGVERLHVEQHRGLVAYQPDEVIFRTACGLLRVTGGNLRFRLYTAKEAVVVGSIGGVGLNGGASG